MTSVDGFDHIKIDFCEEFSRIVLIRIRTISRLDFVQFCTVVIVLKRIDIGKFSSAYAITRTFERQNIREKRVHFSFETIPCFFLIPFFFKSGSDKSHVILVKNGDDDIFRIVDDRLAV